MKPKRNEIIKDYGVEQYQNLLADYIKSNSNDFTAKIDYLKLMLKSGDYNGFRKQYTNLRKESASPALLREFAKYLLFVENDYKRAKVVLDNLVRRNVNEPSWVYYFSGRRKVYFEKLCDNLLYTAIPKNASTSLKTFILKNVLKKEGVNPHSIFGNPFFNTSEYSEEEVRKSRKVLILRKPESRFVSYYSKNIIAEDSLAFEYGISSKDISHLFGLKLQPTLEELLCDFNKYCLVFNDVFHHTLPQAAYVGDLSSYDYICDVSEVDGLVSYVAEYLGFGEGFNSKAPKEMVGLASKEKHQDALIDSIKKIYKDDYLILSLAANKNNLSDRVLSYCPASTVYSFIDEA